MSIGNTVTLTGNATREPELRFTPSGQAVANFGLAVNRRWQNRQTQEWEEATSFIDIVCWAQLGENCAESVGKGTRVTVTGRLDQRSWENQDGDKRSKIEVVADDVAVSLRWATAVVHKNERNDSFGGGSSQGSGSNYGGNQGGNSQGGNSQGVSGRSFGGSQPAQSQPYNPDEEPF